MSGPVVLPAFDGPVVGVCLVCTGNICRSPMADVVLRKLAGRTSLPDGVTADGVTADGTPAGGTLAGGTLAGGGTLGDRLRVSSAGTGPWHHGEPMDPRAAAALSAAGYRDHGHVARQFDAGAVDPGRPDRVDLLVALDRRHQQTLRSLTAGRLGDDRIVLLRSFDRNAGGAVDVPDPYYGGPADFDACLAMIEAGCRGLVAALSAAVAAGVA
ncbi:MAG TPA: low molecular weight protein-tyrosine-phosphatase [Acidimicrobiales bacterium]|nr:low molecular weight protein-tyrosine-phosphatase [Acidimicrobiales bacterium]